MTGESEKAKFVSELEGAKSESVGQLLFKAARLWNEEAIARIQKTNPHIRLAHTRLLPHLDFDGTKLTDLAARMGVTKQAAGELVNDFEAQGILERIADPRDKRAKLIRFTKKGKREMFAGLSLLGTMEAELAKEIGKAPMKELGKTLKKLVEVLERER